MLRALRILALSSAALLAAADVDSAAFLSGCWATTAADGSVIEETWLKPSGSTLSGLGRTVKAGKTTFTELLQIREEKGVLTYFAQLRMGGPVTPFPLLSSSATELVFANPEHDYPTKIIYRKQPNGDLFARVEGRQKDRVVGEDFPYRRVSCN